MNKPTQLDLAWAAGFIDGEGCIQISRRKHRKTVEYKLEVSAVNTKLAPIIRLQSLFGGAADTFNERAKAYKLRNRWRVVDKQAEKCLPLLLPYFTCKCEQAQLGLEYRRALKRSTDPEQIRFRELCYQKMRILNGKGTVAFDKGQQISAKDFTRQINSRLEKPAKFI